ncbi:hypothetical protein D3C74_415350 [compost metagenome]
MLWSYPDAFDQHWKLYVPLGNVSLALTRYLVQMYVSLQSPSDPVAAPTPRVTQTLGGMGGASVE